MGQKDRNENFPIPFLLSCGVALNSTAVGIVLGGVSRSERGDRVAKMQTS